MVCNLQIAAALVIVERSHYIVMEKGNLVVSKQM